MASLNKVLLLGNLVRDPEVRYTASGTPVSTFSLAVNRRVRQGDDWRDEVCFIDVITFGRQAETVGEYLAKGRAALIEGQLRWRSWEGGDGQRRSKHEVIAERVQFLPPQRDDTVEGAVPPEHRKGNTDPELFQSVGHELPF
jgi:single-strand DNA-binding protein